VAIDASKLRHGRVRGRYFRENFAQAGIDLAQIIPELVTNADAAIAASGREQGRIQLRIGPADPDFLLAWKASLRSLRVPALRSWRFELVCTDDGEGVDAETVDQRLGALGVVPEHEGSAAYSVAVFATSGLRRAPAGSRASATGEQSSPGSSLRPATTLTSTPTSWMHPRLARSAANSASGTKAHG